MGRHHRIATALALLLAASAAGCARAPGASPGPAQQALARQAGARGAGDVKAYAAEDGGTILNGTLDGRQFALAVPKSWNHQVLLFAHGYSAPGSSLAVLRNPIQNTPGTELLRVAYAQGFAVAHSAYDKAGVGVQTGVERTLALKHFVDRMGASRVYMSGASMGGTITIALIEQHPQEFAGALAACGPAEWSAEIGAVVDMRALYNYFTAGTKYALPGQRSIKVSALSPVAPRGLGFAQPLWGALQIKRMANPVVALFEDAQKDPNGQAARIIRNVASASGQFGPEFASFVLPLLTVGLGQDDMVSSMGGLVYDNRAKVYRSAFLSDAENAALNKGIERVAADPEAVAYAAQWHDANGRSPVKLVTLHNAVDSLVPYAREKELAAVTAAAGNGGNLLQLTVPPKLGPMPGVKLKGLAHCGFTPDQVKLAWTDLRQWVETGRKPDASSSGAAH